MDLTPNQWYPAEALIEGDKLELRDYSALHQCRHRFLEAEIATLCGKIPERYHDADGERTTRWVPYLQVTLEGVDAALIDGLPPITGISPQLVSQHLMYMRECTFAYDLKIEHHRMACIASGEVCLRLVLDEVEEPSEDLRRKSDGVARAFESGLLDDLTRSRASFRLDVKPFTRKLVALVESDYLPDDAYQIDVLFARWYLLPGEEPLSSPLGSGDGPPMALEECRVMFLPTRRQRGMRVADLFKRHEPGEAQDG